MYFNFDCQEKTPSVKPINDRTINGTGLWISDENAKICKRKKDWDNHYKITIPHNIKGNEGVIPGNTIFNP